MSNTPDFNQATASHTFTFYPYTDLPGGNGECRVQFRYDITKYEHSEQRAYDYMVYINKFRMSCSGTVGAFNFYCYLGYSIITNGVESEVTWMPSEYAEKFDTRTLKGKKGWVPAIVDGKSQWEFFRGPTIQFSADKYGNPPDIKIYLHFEHGNISQNGATMPAKGFILSKKAIISGTIKNLVGAVWKNPNIVTTYTINDSQLSPYVTRYIRYSINCKTDVDCSKFVLLDSAGTQLQCVENPENPRDVTFILDKTYLPSPNTSMDLVVYPVRGCGGNSKGLEEFDEFSSTFTLTYSVPLGSTNSEGIIFKYYKTEPYITIYIPIDKNDFPDSIKKIINARAVSAKLFENSVISARMYVHSISYSAPSDPNDHAIVVKLRTYGNYGDFFRRPTVLNIYCDLLKLGLPCTSDASEYLLGSYQFKINNDVIPEIDGGIRLHYDNNKGFLPEITVKSIPEGIISQAGRCIKLVFNYEGKGDAYICELPLTVGTPRAGTPIPNGSVNSVKVRVNGYDDYPVGLKTLTFKRKITTVLPMYSKITDNNYQAFVFRSDTLQPVDIYAFSEDGNTLTKVENYG